MFSKRGQCRDISGVDTDDTAGIVCRLGTAGILWGGVLRAPNPGLGHCSETHEHVVNMLRADHV